LGKGFSVCQDGKRARRHRGGGFASSSRDAPLVVRDWPTERASGLLHDRAGCPPQGPASAAGREGQPLAVGLAWQGARGGPLRRGRSVGPRRAGELHQMPAHAHAVTHACRPVQCTTPPCTPPSASHQPPIGLSSAYHPPSLAPLVPLAQLLSAPSANARCCTKSVKFQARACRSTRHTASH
jgi:hypothetical protein